MGRVEARRVQAAAKETYLEGKFPHRQKDDSCTYYGELCPVNRKQRVAEDVCAWCIPQRSKHGDKVGEKQ